MSEKWAFIMKFTDENFFKRKTNFQKVPVIFKVHCDSESWCEKHSN